MKVIVAYMSRTGNTKKIAEAIYEEIQTKKEIKECNKVNNLESYDLAFLGFPMEGFGPSKEAKEFLEKYARGRDIALFITHATPEDSPFLEEWLANFKEATAGANLIGIFNCQGALAQNIKDMLSWHSDPQIRSWSKMNNSEGQPDATRIERARIFAKQVLKKCQNSSGLTTR